MKNWLIIVLLFLPIKALEIRKPLFDEIKEVAEVYYSSWHDTFDMDDSSLSPTSCFEMWKEYYQATSKRSVLLIARIDDTIVGASFARPKKHPHRLKGRVGEISKLYVLPAYKKQGIGSALLKATLHELHRRGFTKAMVQSLTANKGANHFYEKIGGIVIEQQKDITIYAFNLTTDEKDTL